MPRGHRKSRAWRFFCVREPTTGSAPALALPNPVSPTPNPRLPMINITLPDGSRREFDKPVSVMDVAQSIGPGLAQATVAGKVDGHLRSEEHTSELQSLMRISYAVFCMKKKKTANT